MNTLYEKLVPRDFDNLPEKMPTFGSRAVPYSLFIKAYPSSREAQWGQWIERKIIALPSVIWKIAVVAYRIHEIVLSLFIFRSTRLTGHEYRTFQANLMLSEMGEALGRLLGLFHEASGLYLVQRNRCERKFYKSDMRAYEDVSQASNLIREGKLKESDEAISHFNESSKVRNQFLGQICEAYLDNGEVDKAQSLLEQLHRSSPKKDQLSQKIFQVLLSMGRLEEARSFLDYVHDSARGSLARTLVERLIESGEVDQARKVAGTHPSKKEMELLRLKVVDALIISCRFQEALDELKQISHIPPTFSGLSTLCSALLERGWETKELVSILRTVRYPDGRLPDGLLTRFAVSLSHAQRGEEAYQLTENLPRLGAIPVSELAEIYFGEIERCLREGDLERTFNVCEGIHGDDSVQGKGFTKLGRCFFDDGQYERAIQCLLHLSKPHPDADTLISDLVNLGLSGEVQGFENLVEVLARLHTCSEDTDQLCQRLIGTLIEQNNFMLAHNAARSLSGIDEKKAALLNILSAALQKQDYDYLLKGMLTFSHLLHNLTQYFESGEISFRTDFKSRHNSWVQYLKGVTEGLLLKLRSEDGLTKERLNHLLSETYLNGVHIAEMKVLLFSNGLDESSFGELIREYMRERMLEKAREALSSHVYSEYEFFLIDEYGLQEFARISDLYSGDKLEPFRYACVDALMQGLMWQDLSSHTGDEVVQIVKGILFSQERVDQFKKLMSAPQTAEMASP